MLFTFRSVVERFERKECLIWGPDRVCSCLAGESAIEAGGDLNPVQLQAALEMLQEELAGSHAEAATLGKQASDQQRCRAVLCVTMCD